MGYLARNACLTLCALVALAVLPARAAEVPRRVITVSAMAEFEVPPTEVVLSLAVVTENEELLIAKHLNDGFTLDVLKLAEKYRIPKEQFELHTLSIEPRYSRSGYGQPRELLGYTVTRGIDVTIKRFDQLEPVLSDALAAGANRVDDILWRTMDHRKHQFEARTRAVEHAKEKATHLAELNGLKLGRAITILEDVEGRWNREVGGFGGFGGAMARGRQAMPEQGHQPEPAVDQFRLVAAQVRRPAADDGDAAPRATAPVAPGTITVSAEVTITFELLPPDGG